MHSSRAETPSTIAVACNLLVVYILWGSTYLAIRLAVETLPPFLSAATRFLIAGALMVGFLWLRGRLSRSPSAQLEPIRKEHWRSAAISWATGSLYSRTAPMPRSGLLGTGMEMLAGGVILVVAGVLTGELGRTHPSNFSAVSLLGVGWLIVFGSLVAFSSYTWLLRHAPVSTLATYAYVNPIVAVALGAFFLQEPITPRTI